MFGSFSQPADDTGEQKNPFDYRVNVSKLCLNFIAVGGLEDFWWSVQHFVQRFSSLSISS